jgi:hypothetical protein
MMLRLCYAVGLLLLLAATVIADDTDPRDKLLGKWQPATAKDAGEVWLLELVGDSLRISHSMKQKTDAIECNIMGQDCEVKVGGRKTKVSLWFNGDMLVEMEMRGTEVIKRRFRIAENGTLKLETMQIAPPGRTETAEFKRVAAAR